MMIHPDTWFDTHQHEQKTRVAESTKKLALKLQDRNRSTLKDKLLLMSGESFIRIGRRLKGSAQQAYREPQLIK